MSKQSNLPESTPRITRIKAGGKKAKRIKVDNKTSAKTKKDTTSKRTNPIRALGLYFKAAFREIKLVKWPTRKETWAMTLAVLIYGLIMIAVVLLFDNIYDWLFKLIIK